MPGCVEPVGARVMRVPQAELFCAGVHHHHEAGLVSLTDVIGEGVRRVVRTLDQRALEQVTDGEPLAAAQPDRRLADGGRTRGDGDDLIRLRPLEGQQDCH